MPVQLICQSCKCPYQVIPNLAKKGSKYCSKKCHFQSKQLSESVQQKVIQLYLGGMSSPKVARHLGISVKGVRNTLKRNTVSFRTHSEAGKLIQKTPEWNANISASKKGKGCYFYGKSPSCSGFKGKRVLVPHLNTTVRSTWEAEIATLLLDLGLDHIYEPLSRRFLLTSVESTYMPDFYLPNEDLFIEVKGRIRQSTLTKMTHVVNDFPDACILLLDEDAYKDIKGNPPRLQTFISERCNRLTGDNICNVMRINEREPSENIRRSHKSAS